MRLDHSWICTHIPHQGSMCLLDQVLSWDAQQLLCRAGDHRDRNHPLRAHGRLGSACAIEYAAQAVAVHGALLQTVGREDTPPRRISAERQPPALPQAPGIAFGMLTSARAVDLVVARLDDLPGVLLVSATRLHGDADSALYSFALEEQRTSHAAAGAPRLIARGRLSLWLNGAARAASVTNARGPNDQAR